MEKETLPPAQGNGRRMRTIEFDEADAPMLMAAMRLAAATAYTYGPDQRRAVQRLQHYQALFLAFAPTEAAMFGSECSWAEIAIAMDGADAFVVSWSEGSWPDYAKGTATVAIGDRTWETGYGKGITRDHAIRLARALEEMAPMDCELRLGPGMEIPE